VQTFSGSFEIFLFISLVFIILGAAYFRISSGVSIMMIGVFAVLMAAFGASWILITLILIGGIMLYFTLSKLFR
jgi:hypothetical protein